MWKKIFTAFGLILVLIAMTIGGIFGRSAGDTVFQFFSFSGISIAQSLPKAQMQFQQIEDLNLKYASSFSLNEAESKDIMSSLPLNAKNQVRMLSVYSSEPTCGIGEIRVIRVVYAPDVGLNIDGTTAGAIKQVSTLNGIVNLEHSITSIEVSGYPARKISFKANRWGGVLGGEFLFIADTDSKTIWQLQLIFSAKNSNHEKLIGARTCANEVLKTISIRQRTTNFGQLIDEMSSKCELVFDGQSHEECCKEKNIKNCPKPLESPAPEKYFPEEEDDLLTIEGIYGLVAITIIIILTIVVIFLAFRKRWIQNFTAYMSDTTKATFTGWIIWIFIVLSYVILLSPYGYIDNIDNDDLLHLTLWCILPPLLALAVYLWVNRFTKSRK